jgi:hypothetical protein
MGKRALSLVFLGFYIISIVGLSINLHYCGTRLAQVQFPSQEIRACCSEKVEKTAHCCKNQAITYKVKDQHLGNSSIHVPSLITALSTNREASTSYTNEINVDKYAFKLQKPPPNTRSKTIFFSVFRI